MLQATARTQLQRARAGRSSISSLSPSRTNDLIYGGAFPSPIRFGQGVRCLPPPTHCRFVVSISAMTSLFGSLASALSQRAISPSYIPAKAMAARYRHHTPWGCHGQTLGRHRFSQADSISCGRARAIASSTLEILGDTAVHADDRLIEPIERGVAASANQPP